MYSKNCIYNNSVLGLWLLLQKKAGQPFVPQSCMATPFPVGTCMETLGAIGPKSLVFLKELGRKIRQGRSSPSSITCNNYLWQYRKGTLPLFYDLCLCEMHYL